MCGGLKVAIVHGKFAGTLGVRGTPVKDRGIRIDALAPGSAAVKSGLRHGDVIMEGQSVVFAGSGTDPDGDLPLTYSWDFQEAQSGVPPSTSQIPGPVAFSQTGTFTVTFTVTDSTGLSDPTPASVGVTVLVNQPPESQIDDPSCRFVAWWRQAGESNSAYNTG